MALVGDVAGMRAWQILGFTADGDSYCTGCAERVYGPDRAERRDREGNPVHPVFAEDEWTYVPVCAACGAALGVRLVEGRGQHA